MQFQTNCHFKELGIEVASIFNGGVRILTDMFKHLNPYHSNIFVFERVAVANKLFVSRIDNSGDPGIRDPA